MHIIHTNNNLIRIETDTNNISQTSGIEFGIPAFNSATRSKITSTTFSGDASDLQFYTSSSTNNSTARLTINQNGNVGIGNTNPLINFSVGSTNDSHTIGRAIMNATNQHFSDKRDALSIGGCGCEMRLQWLWL